MNFKIFTAGFDFVAGCVIICVGFCVDGLRCVLYGWSDLCARFALFLMGVGLWLVLFVVVGMVWADTVGLCVALIRCFDGRLLLTAVCGRF